MPRCPGSRRFAEAFAVRDHTTPTTTGTTTVDRAPTARWYEGVTRYQWLVLAIASLGWVFDVFEGQIFVASMNEAMPALLPPGATAADIPFYRDITFGAFLAG